MTPFGPDKIGPGQGKSSHSKKTTNAATTAKAKKVKGSKKEPWSLTKPLDRKTYQQELNAASRLKYRPAEREYRNQLRVSDVMQRRTDDWFDEYKQEVDRAHQRTGATYGTASAAVRGFADQGAAQDSARQAKLQGIAEQDAQLRGTAVDPSIAQTGAAAQSARRVSMEQNLGNLSTHGAANLSYLSNQRRNVAGQELVAHQEEAGRKRKILQSKLDLKNEKGDFKKAYRGELRNSERNYSLALETLGLNKTKAQAAAALAAASFGETKRKNRELERQGKGRNRNTRRGQDISSRDRTAAEAGRNARDNGGSSGGGGPSHSEKRRGKDYMGKARALVGNYSSGALRGKQSQVVASLVSKGIPSDIALAAYQIRMFGGVGKHTRGQLWKRYRIKWRGFPSKGGWGTGQGR